MKHGLTWLLLTLLCAGCAFVKGIDSGTRTYGLGTNQAVLGTNDELRVVIPPGMASGVQTDVSRELTFTATKNVVTPPTTVSVPVWWDLPADTNVAYVTAYVDTTPGQGVFSASQQNLPLGTNAVLQLPADRPSYVMVATRTAGGGEAPGNEALFVPSGCPLYAAQSNGLMTVVWYGVQGTVYTLQGQAELGTHWAEVAASIPGTNGPNVWSEVPLTPEGYFRLKLN